MRKLLGVFAVIAVLIQSCNTSPRPDLGEGIFANIDTDLGAIILQLEYEKVPVTTANFVSLAEGTNQFVSEELKGKSFYDSILFHRVIKDFMIQTGDPQGTGMGGPGYQFKDEFDERLSHNDKGILSMANAGPGTNGSQFFITHAPTPYLDGRHSVFGKVVEGLNVVDSIASVATESDRPVEDLYIKHISIYRNGSDATSFDANKVMADYFKEEEKAKEAYAEKTSEWAKEAEAQKAEARFTDSGLGIYVLKEGTGEKTKNGEMVNVSYAGYFESGALFDSNIENIAMEHGKLSINRKNAGGYNPIPMQCSMDAQLIAGFKEGLLSMEIGQKVRLFIPPHLGWGENGAGSVIPPNANVIFDVEIVSRVEE